ncbi:MAG: adenylate/guanylate cyclase domain-containing protein, partial [Candidatus Brocadiia bacterium]|nr:adenylate/guanylate cyclase domain-containing protein [Candidatus Brocadiia bacterium]
MHLPSGTVTFLFTDIEGSARLWEEYPLVAGRIVERHYEILGEQIEARGGRVFKTVGDAVCAVFADAVGAAAAALSAQLALCSEQWEDGVSVRVRMAVHVGVAEERDGDYFGAPLNRCARLMGSGHGGQILMSQAAYELVRDTPPDGASFTDLGQHRLRDLRRPERIVQLSRPDLPSEFAALRSLDVVPNNLPAETTT